jgi:hypothetical protein
MARKKKTVEPALITPFTLFTADEERSLISEAEGIQRVLAAQTRPWLTSGPPWISGLSHKKAQTYAVKHYQEVGHRVEYTDRGAECTVCQFKVFWDLGK